MTARHSAQQYTRQISGQVGLLALGIFVPAARPFGQVSSQALGVLFLRYGRDDELQAIARDSELARRLMTVPGVGPIVALGFIATVDDVSRFAKATDVGAYLGLTPRRYQSGEMDYSGRISKRGDSAMRALLYEAASALITRVRRFSPLKSWAVRLAARKGFKKAAVATARKIAVVMLRLWRDGTTFAWTKEEMPA